MTKLNKQTKLWFWLLLLAAGLSALFMLSAFQMFTGEHTKLIIQRLTGLNEDQSYMANAIARKAAHVMIFGLLALLLYKVFRQPKLWYAWLCTVLLAVLDEWHQTFVPGRSPSVRDIVLDSAAALIILTGTVLWRRR
ncbi:VanZ family protein [Paenibacillus sp. TAB 01]|uniref:VanZ family protein n=1 Tax=Paenibacillus sp. TAB 01 TaxID=3368988 RepID=UPI0037516336